MGGPVLPPSRLMLYWRNVCFNSCDCWSESSYHVCNSATLSILHVSVCDKKTQLLHQSLRSTVGVLLSLVVLVFRQTSPAASVRWTGWESGEDEATKIKNRENPQRKNNLRDTSNKEGTLYKILERSNARILDDRTNNCENPWRQNKESRESLSWEILCGF